MAVNEGQRPTPVFKRAGEELRLPVVSAAAAVFLWLSRDSLAYCSFDVPRQLAGF